MRPCALLVTILFAAASLAACGGDTTSSTTAPSASSFSLPTSEITGTPTGTAEDALKQQFNYLSTGQWGAEWDLLHPAQQELVSRDHYIACGPQANLPNVDSIEIVTSTPESLVIPGTTVTADATAVTVKLTLSRGTVTSTRQSSYREFNVDGTWRWILSNPVDYAGDKCPSTASTTSTSATPAP